MVQKNEILDNDSGFTNGNWCLTAQHVGEYLEDYVPVSVGDVKRSG
jgi:hypothetical protein